MQTTTSAHLTVAQRNNEFEQARQHFINKDYDAAASICHRILSVNPKGARALHLLGLIFSKRDKHYAALNFIEEAISQKPETALYWTDKGLTEVFLYQFDNARASFAKLVELLEDQGIGGTKLAEAYFYLGSTYYYVSEYQEALKYFAIAVGLSDEPSGELIWNRALSNLALGNYEAAWPEYEIRIRDRIDRKRKGDVWPGAKPWQGESLEGKTLVIYSEQGLGDAIQYSRFLPMVKAQGATVIYEANPAILSLFEDFSDSIDELRPRVAQERPSIECDYYIYYMSLPYRLGITLENLPTETPYFHAKPNKVDQWKSRVDEVCTQAGPKIGIVWGGKPSRNIILSKRSYELKAFYPYIKDIEGVNWVGLQKGEESAQLDELPQGHQILNLGDDFEDFSDTAAVIEQLDLIVTIDTSVAHMAAAMNKPTWVMLSFPADWRWISDSDKCHWYPSMKLFRQARNEDRTVMFHKISSALRLYVEEFSKEK